MYKIDKTTIFLTRGDTLLAQLSLIKDGEEYTPIEGDTIQFALKHASMKTNGTAYVDKDPIIVKNVPIDTMMLRLEPEDTKELLFGEYAYDIQITFANGIVDTFIHDTLHLLPEVD